MKYRVIKTWNGLYNIECKRFWLGWIVVSCTNTPKEAEEWLDTLQRLFDQQHHPEVVLQREITKTLI